MEEEKHRALDKLLLFAASLLLLFQEERGLFLVVPILLEIIYLSLSLYVDRKRSMCWLITGFVFLSFFVWKLWVFLPIICYDLWWFEIPGGILPLGVGMGHVLTVFYEQFGSEGADGSRTIFWLLFLILEGLLALWLAYHTKSLSGLYRKYIHLQDNDREEQMRMKRKNKDLLEKQDYEVHVATLQERNRIAREIHDNVGHMLSRAILQMGALRTLHPEEPFHTQLSGVGDTLNEAMNSIRESVHDLHNESLDLHQAVQGLAKNLNSGYQVKVEYDMAGEVPRKIKYCFLAIIKEGFANVMKHSTGDRVYVLLREHPGFYQLMLEDNGKNARISEGRGIGLQNMEDRIAALGGTIHFSVENGFRILVSVPKEKEGEKSR